MKPKTKRTKRVEEKFYFFTRWGTPPGITVSRTPELPTGDFGITEFSWGQTSLWFIDSHRFTANERQQAYLDYKYGETLPLKKPQAEQPTE